jgi:excisionase family DNA binding protein
MPDLLSIEDVATQLKVQPRTVLEWLRTGKLPGYKLGRLWRVDPEDLKKFLAQHKRPGGKPPGREGPAC